MTRLGRELVGRAAVGVIGLALLWGGWKVITAGIAVSRDEAARRAAAGGDDGRGRGRDGGGAIALYVLGGLLAVPGGVVTLLAVLPTAGIARVMGPPRNTSLGEDPSDLLIDTEPGWWARWWWR